MGDLYRGRSYTLADRSYKLNKAGTHGLPAFYYSDFRSNVQNYTTLEVRSPKPTAASGKQAVTELLHALLFFCIAWFYLSPEYALLELHYYLSGPKHFEQLFSPIPAGFLGA